MTNIKGYTDIDQSKKLAKILSLESADMFYECTKEEPEYEYKVYVGKNVAITYNMFSYRNGYTIPCWSLAALLSILPKIGSEEPMIRKFYYANNPTERYICQYSLTDITSEYDNPVDACYEMIIKLHELNLL